MPETFLHSEITYKIRGVCFEVFNTLGSGQKESVYQKALIKEFSFQKIPFVAEPLLSVLYKNEKVGGYKPDFVIDDKVLLELKSLDFLPTAAIQQFTHYLKGTPYEVGLLINFGPPKLFIHRATWFNKV